MAGRFDLWSNVIFDSWSRFLAAESVAALECGEVDVDRRSTTKLIS